VPFALAIVVLTPPIWWWLVRGRTDQPVRGAFAGLLVGPLSHALMIGFLAWDVRVHGRNGGLANLAYVLVGMMLLVATFVAAGVGPLVGLLAVRLQRLWPIPRENSNSVAR